MSEGQDEAQNTEADRPTDPDSASGTPDGAEAGPVDVSSGEGGDAVDPNPPESAEQQPSTTDEVKDDQ